jgi:oligopeptide transport system substrate-binding protein
MSRLVTRRQFGCLGASAAALAACGRRERPIGVLRVGLAGAPDSLDPFVAEFAAAAILLNQIHAPLESYWPGKGLAEAWEANADATQWRARLREGLVWSDGAPLTAADMVWSVRHGLRPDSTYPGIGDLRPIADVRADGERFVVFDLDRPLGVFPDTMREFYPIPPHVYEQHGRDWIRPENFVGAGPYLPAAMSQLSVTLTRNPDYFDAWYVGIGEIEVSAIDDAATRIRMFRSGDLDLAQDPPWEALSGTQTGARVYDAPRLTYLKPNHARPLLGDARVRRALSLAIDRQFIAETLHGGFASAAAAIIPASPNADVRPLETGREEAQRLIAEAGAEGAALELLQSGGEREGVAVALADDWAQIGIGTTISRTDATGLYAAVAEGRFDLALSRFDRGMKSDPWRFLEPFAPDGFAAHFGWRSPALGAALSAIRAEADSRARAELAYAAERDMLAEMALIPIQHERAAWLEAPWLDGPDTGQKLFWGDLTLRYSDVASS